MKIGKCLAAYLKFSGNFLLLSYKNTVELKYCTLCVQYKCAIFVLFFKIVFYSCIDASHAEICFVIHSHIVPGPVQETVGGAGFELGTAASSVWCAIFVAYVISICVTSMFTCQSHVLKNSLDDL
jgi:hypothetical protein